MKKKIANSKPSEITYGYAYWLLEQWKKEVAITLEELYVTMNRFQLDNYILRSQFAKQNLKELAIDVDVDVGFEKVVTPYMNQLVKDSVRKMEQDVESLIMAMILTHSTVEVEQYLTNEGVPEQVTNQLMKVYRTENTQMRSDYVELAIGTVAAKGHQIKRKWVHTLSNPNVSVSSGYTPRNDHVALDGVLEDENGQFTTRGGNSTTAPGEFGIPSEDINCRCDVVFVSV